MQYLLGLISAAALATAHGVVETITIDGTTYPSFDPRLDLSFPGVKRINWGYQKTNFNGTGPVENVNSPDITCRQGPLIPPGLTAVARAGAEMSFQWTGWFHSHKGPIMTYMGYMPDEKMSVQDVEFFKIDEGAYDPKTAIWGTDQLMNENSVRKMRIPSDIKPGTYVVRHEILALHFAFTENQSKKTSGAQFYPICLKLKVLGDGKASPPGVKFPGGYKWNDPGILDNIYYGPNQYISPGPPVYNGPRDPPKGSPPVIEDTGELKGEIGIKYAAEKARYGQKIKDAAASDYAQGMTGGGGCHWEPGADPSTAKCVVTNPTNPLFKGFGQPKGSPLYGPGAAAMLYPAPQKAATKFRA